MNQQPLRTEAIKRFLLAKTHRDLAELYNPNMEVQVNVAQDGGRRIDSTYKGRSFMAWTDDVEQWKSFRIPYNASTEPEYTDVPMSFNLEKHVEGIGMTGWDWKNRVSKWCAYDFDAIVGHSDRHVRKSSDEELRQIEALLKNIPWVTLRYSTSGRGLHLYIFTPDVPTANHNEHAALARAILAQMSAFVGFDFSSKVDVNGGNMWVFHRKMLNNNGLMLIKAGGMFEDIPKNWRDHIEVVRGNRRRIKQGNLDPNSSDQEDLFEELTSKAPAFDLDEQHKKHIEWLSNNGAYWYWDPDRKILVTHTWHLQEMHADLGLKGIFKTMSQGTERGTDANCFAFPLRRGAWAVRRFTPGVMEDASWLQDGSGWTKCYLNRDPDLPSVAGTNGGKERGGGGYQFDDAKSAVDTAVALGAEVNLPPRLMNREATLKVRKTDRKLILQVKREGTDTNDQMDGWVIEGKKWEKVLSVRTPTLAEPEIEEHDDLIRHLVTPNNEDAGWVLRSSNSWTVEPLMHITLALKSQGYETKDAQLIIGNSVMRCWTLVNQPFKPEYPGGRVWNRTAAQFRFKPNLDADSYETPTWDRFLNHLGSGLDVDIKEHPWCMNNGLLTGGDYLRCWIASLFQHPFEPLPYLFLYSKEQNTGKTTFHEALDMLLTPGAVTPAATALTSEGNFNGELATSILCTVEELDLGKGKGKSLAYNRIKDWVTSRNFLVHPKSKTPYTIPNTTHWVQTANNHTACPIFPGDTRITMVHVPPIDPLELIPKRQFMELLKAEASDFLGAMLKLEIPPSNDRLFIPVIQTEAKEQAARVNKTALEVYIDEECYRVDGEMVKFSDFYEGFITSLGMTAEDSSRWSKHLVKKELPNDLAYGASHKNNQRYIGNLSFTAKEPGVPDKPKITVKNEKLFQDGIPI